MNIFQHINLRKYSVFVITLLVFTGIMSPTAQRAHGANASEQLTITGISVTSVSDTSLSPVRRQVTISGVFTNTSSQTAYPTIQLLTGKAIATRSELMSAMKSNKYSQVAAHEEVATLINNVGPQKSQNWQLTFNGDDYFSNEEAVAVFGVQLAGTTEQVLLPHSWYFKDSIKPTQLLVNATITTSAFNPVGQDVGLAIGANEIDRINNLLDSLPDKSQVAVDPYLRDWLQDFSQTELSGKATQLSERLNRYSTYSSVYAQTNIFRTVSNELSGITKAALTTADTSTSIYSPASEFVSKSVFNTVADVEDTLMVLPSDVFGGAQQSIAAHGIANGTDFLIADSGLAECFLINDELLSRACLTSMLTTITAESPNKSRSISLQVPLNALTVSSLKVLADPGSFGNTFSLTDINSVLESPAVTHSIPQGPTLRADYSTSLRKGLANLANQAKSVAAVFEDESLYRQLNATRFIAVSSMHDQNDENLDIVNNAITYASDQLHTLSLQGSSRVTIPGFKSELPITIVNGSDHTATVGIQLSSSLPGRISSQNIDVVTIDPGKRITVSVPITISGAGLIPVQASLTSRNNDTFGKPLAIAIASSAYQDIARNLVWTALALLVLLLANGIRKRRRVRSTD